MKSMRLALWMFLQIGTALTANAEIFFVDEAATRGVSYVADDLETSEVGVAGQSQGAAFVDLDQDGDDDLVLLGELDAPFALFENSGSGFFTRRSGAGLPALDKPSSVTAADYDADGDPDLFISQFNAANFFFRNDGDFQFVDVTSAAGLSDDGATTGTTWGDYDLDGHLDLYVGNYPNSYDTTDNRLYRNLGDGTFQELAASLGLHDPGGMTFQASFIDYDLDGDVDLYSVNDRGSVGDMLGNRLWKNQGNGTFLDVSAASGAGLHMFAMGIACGDLDLNGWPDFYVTNIETNALLLNNGSTFVDRSVQWKTLGNRVSWGTVFFDCDNDAYLDIFACNTPLGTGDSPAPRLYDCNGAAPCTDVAASAGLNLITDAYGVTSSDIDRDGDVDLLVVRPDLPVNLYVNQLADPSRHWLEVRLVADSPQHQPVGATVFVQAGGKTQQRSLVLGSSYKSQLSADLHFGLDTATVVDSVEVLWPGGDRTCLNQVQPHQLLVIHPSRAVDVPLPAADPLPPNGQGDFATVSNLQWADAGDVTYDLYLGDSSPPPFLTSTTSTSYAPGELSPGSTYFWRIDTRACDTTVGETWSFSLAGDGNDNDNTAPPIEEPPGNDNQSNVAPSLSITSPTEADSLITSDPGIVVSGVASGPVASIQWTNHRGGGGPCTGLESWSTASIALYEGENIITITALAANDLQAIDVLTVTNVPAGSIDPLPPLDQNGANDNQTHLANDNSSPDSDPQPTNSNLDSIDNNVPDAPVDNDNAAASDPILEPDAPNPTRPASRSTGLPCGAAMLEVAFLLITLRYARRN